MKTLNHMFLKATSSPNCTFIHHFYSVTQHPDNFGIFIILTPGFSPRPSLILHPNLGQRQTKMLRPYILFGVFYQGCWDGHRHSTTSFPWLHCSHPFLSLPSNCANTVLRNHTGFIPMAECETPFTASKVVEGQDPRFSISVFDRLLFGRTLSKDLDIRMYLLLLSPS